MSGDWQIGPLETAPSDIVDVVYTGTNVSDSGLSSLGTQKQDELEIKILNAVAKKFVGQVAGAGLGEALGSAFSEAFDKAFSDPVGDLIGYKRQGPCNGNVFAAAVPFRGSDLDHLAMSPLTYTYFPGTQYPETRTSEFPGIRFTHSYNGPSDARYQRVRWHRRDRCHIFGMSAAVYLCHDLGAQALPEYSGEI
jgi:hypothetical protein